MEKVILLLCVHYYFSVLMEKITVLMKFWTLYYVAHNWPIKRQLPRCLIQESYLPYPS